MKINTKYDIGDELEDKVTGLTGVVMVVAKYATGCISYGLLPRTLSDGKEHKWSWLDESRLFRTEKDAVNFGKTDTGGPHPNPPQG